MRVRLIFILMITFLLLFVFVTPVYAKSAEVVYSNKGIIKWWK